MESLNPATVERIDSDDPPTEDELKRRIARRDGLSGYVGLTGLADRFGISQAASERLPRITGHRPDGG